jgi:sigma-B regulation protein RsbU (phosphoserine phosphatase)
MVHNILIVDDIAKNIQVLGSILLKDGYAISYATNGHQALEMVGTENYDLILLDIMMPELDGFEVCRRIKQMPGKQDIPIIYLTARTQKHDIVEGLNSGAVDYITKPFNSAELKARVLTQLQLKEARDRIAEQNFQLKEQNNHLEKLNQELKDALEKIKTLEGIIPICSICKNIRDDKGYWERIEAFMCKHSDAVFSHGICPECAKKHYPDFDLYGDREKNNS